MYSSRSSGSLRPPLPPPLACTSTFFALQLCLFHPWLDYYFPISPGANRHSFWLWTITTFSNFKSHAATNTQKPVALHIAPDISFSYKLWSGQTSPTVYSDQETPALRYFAGLICPSLTITIIGSKPTFLATVTASSLFLIKPSEARCIWAQTGILSNLYSRTSENPSYSCRTSAVPLNKHSPWSASHQPLPISRIS